MAQFILLVIAIFSGVGTLWQVWRMVWPQARAHRKAAVLRLLAFFFVCAAAVWMVGAFPGQDPTVVAFNKLFNNLADELKSIMRERQAQKEVLQDQSHTARLEAQLKNMQKQLAELLDQGKRNSLPKSELTRIASLQAQVDQITAHPVPLNPAPSKAEAQRPSVSPSQFVTAPDKKTNGIGVIPEPTSPTPAPQISSASTAAKQILQKASRVRFEAEGYAPRSTAQECADHQVAHLNQRGKLIKIGQTNPNDGCLSLILSIAPSVVYDGTLGVEVTRNRSQLIRRMVGHSDLIAHTWVESTFPMPTILEPGSYTILIDSDGFEKTTTVKPVEIKTGMVLRGTVHIE